MNKISALIVITVSIISCALIAGERVLVVSGELGEDLKNCTIEVVSKKSQFQIYTLPIQGGFKIDHTIEARNKLYIANINCSNIIVATKEFSTSSIVTQVEFGNVSNK